MSSDPKPIVLEAPYSVYVELCAWRSGKKASGRMVDRLSRHPSFVLTRVPPRHATSSLWAVPPARCESRADRLCDIVTDGMPPPNQLFTWRRLYASGALSAVGAGEEVVAASEYRALQHRAIAEFW